MPILEDLKEYAKRATGLQRPGKGGASDFGRARKLHAVRFKDDGPNHPRGQTGHQRISADDDFLFVGAYPPAGTYDHCTTVEDCPRVLKTVPKVALPRKDPAYGTGGPLSKLWKKAR